MQAAAQCCSLLPAPAGCKACSLQRPLSYGPDGQQPQPEMFHPGTTAPRVGTS